MKFVRTQVTALALLLSMSLLPHANAGVAPKNEQKIPVNTPQAVLVSAQPMLTLPAETLGTMLSQYGITPRNGVSIYRVSYRTTTPHGDPVQASGVVFVPDSKAPVYPWLSLQHGTVVTKTNAPSLAPFEGLVESSQGFVTVVADYLGYGDSADLLHPYIIAESYQAPLVDMLRAARELLTQSKINLGPLFLKGYSEGGYATLALQKVLETELSEEFTVAASAPSAGPYDVDLTGSLNVQNPEVNPINLPFVVLSYDYWLADNTLPLDDIFEVETALVKDALSGAYTGQEIFAMLPTAADELFNPAFIQDFLAPQSTLPGVQEFHDLLRSQNLLEGWTPKAPTRFYHCVDDEEIPVVISENAVAKFQGRGATNVSAFIIPSPNPTQPYRHSTCPAIFAPVQWFGELLAQ